MTKRIFRSIFITALAAMTLVGALLAFSQYKAYDDKVSGEIRAEAGYILQALSREQNEADYFQGLVSANRVTLISPDGSVLYDSVSKPAVMENHRGRPEVESALASGEGVSRRVSDTISQEAVYYAVKTPDGNVLRVSYTQSSVWGMFKKTLGALVLTFGVAAIMAYKASELLAKRIVEPINRLNLDDPLDNDAYDELSPLLVRMVNQNREINDKFMQLGEKQREFEALSDNMREGLVLLDAGGNVVSINTAACGIFGVDVSECGGCGYLVVSRSNEFERVVSDALEGERAEAEAEYNNRFYQLIASPVNRGAIRCGALVLALDVTEKHSAERERREFTANVTHELKTPLTSISGYAEIIKDGVARPEDIKSFAGRIYDEANRLVALVEDILRLSQLDERTGLPPFVKTDLMSAAREVCGRLAAAARDNCVKLDCSGESVFIEAIPKALDELIANLIDNAIKYNKPNGEVRVRVSGEGGSAVLSVEDSGIGIPDAHRERVFERFYRVDKSHSKQTGGTGLGLAIVKHAAAVHGAELSLTSEPEKGTTVTVRFDALPA